MIQQVSVQYYVLYKVPIHSDHLLYYTFYILYITAKTTALQIVDK